MSETKNVLIVVAAILLAVVIYSFGTRYQMVATSTPDKHYAYMYDRFTGKTWVISKFGYDYYWQKVN